MDYSELLPGLLKAMEERLGPLGRPLTTAVLLCAVMWFFLFFYETFDRVVITPAFEGGVGEEFVSALFRMIVIAGLGIIIMLTFERWFSYRLNKHYKKVQADAERAAKLLDEVEVETCALRELDRQVRQNAEESTKRWKRTKQECLDLLDRIESKQKDSGGRQ